MEREIKVVIPSAGRPNRVSTTKHVAGAILCVPEKQVELYKEYNPGVEVVTHPNEIVGMGNKRNWICEKFGTVFMIDDDTAGLQRLYETRVSVCTADEAYGIIQNLGNLAILSGCYLFGFSKYANTLNYTGLKPFSMVGYINAVGIGLVEKSMLKFSDKIQCNNDVYISCLNAHYYHKCFIDARFSFKQNSINRNTGGMSIIRTPEVEEGDIIELKRVFGPAIQTKQRAKSAKKWNITLKFPF